MVVISHVSNFSIVILIWELPANNCMGIFFILMAKLCSDVCGMSYVFLNDVFSVQLSKRATIVYTKIW